eukprot:CAMPEP_0172504980 /NCGR_PEP_ID=MMETSP1066-20121228/182725_1 /TAXON_ID=671091 /ORGANISM="Coscinodiscus wailesii, Strain CCMP2513" /LENGTH=273 /DNA_ID=CAMNT_0013281401 /DNA_START=209 /DNA_END=1030 /DNA_ORIENTATION=-
MTSSPESTKFTAKTDPSSVVVLPDADAVSKRIQSIVTDAAAEAIAERGHFILAIPGGSILKMLVNLESAADWAPKTTLVYVNHKCVPMDDADAATHAKAQKLFLNDWQNAGLNAIILSGTSDGPAEASRYERQLKDLPETICPRCAPSDAGDLPRFDLALIGVGDDGHVGSLYPDRDEVTIDEFGPWVLSVAMKDPPSITLSLPVMANAKRVVVAACGVSEKYPQGKSAGMRRAVVEEGEDLRSFPAVGLRGVATWVMDEAAASKLGPEYGAE